MVAEVILVYWKIEGGIEGKREGGWDEGQGTRDKGRELGWVDDSEELPWKEERRKRFHLA